MDPDQPEPAAPALGDESTLTARGSGGPAHEAATGARYYGRYQLLGELGAGGMGIVYEAYDPELDRRVALKVIGHAQRRLGSLARERLLREARAMARLSHPNVISIYDVGSIGDDAFVAMELVKGRTLKEWLRERPSLDQVLELFAQAGRGLAAAHAAGLVHRDFKPSNVMVGEDGRVRVLDFGLARQVEGEPSDSDADGPVASSPSLGQLTHTGGIVGTPAYMAPEQLAGGEVDERSDQFSFCVALHEALYGVAPFAGDSLEERETRIASGDIAPEPAESRVPARLRAAVLRGLRPRPEQRHPSIDALLGELVAQPPSRRWAAPAIGLLIAAIAIIAWLAWPASGGADGDPSRLRMQMADSDSAQMMRLARFAADDPRAERLGIEAELSMWSIADGAEMQEHYLSGPDPEALESYLASTFRARDDLRPEPGHEILLEREEDRWRTHYLWTRIELDGSMIDEVAVTRTEAGEPEVTIRLDERGRAQLAAVTGQNRGRRMATIVDQIVVSSPVIRGPILGGQVSISMQAADPDAMARAARELADRLAPASQ